MALKGDRRQRVETTGEDVGQIFTRDPPIPCKAWRRMRGWYRAAVDHALPPAQITLERITAERVEIYRVVSPPGENIPTSVEPNHIDDYVPTEEEVKWAVRRLRGEILGGPYRMRARIYWS